MHGSPAGGHLSFYDHKIVWYHLSDKLYPTASYLDKLMAIIILRFTENNNRMFGIFHQKVLGQVSPCPAPFILQERSLRYREIEGPHQEDGHLVAGDRHARTVQHRAGAAPTGDALVC